MKWALSLIAVEAIAAETMHTRARGLRLPENLDQQTAHAILLRLLSSKHLNTSEISYSQMWLSGLEITPLMMTILQARLQSLLPLMLLPRWYRQSFQTNLDRHSLPMEIMMLIRTTNTTSRREIKQSSTACQLGSLGLQKHLTSNYRGMVTTVSSLTSLQTD